MSALKCCYRKWMNTFSDLESWMKLTQQNDRMWFFLYRKRVGDSDGKWPDELHESAAHLHHSPRCCCLHPAAKGTLISLLEPTPPPTNQKSLIILCIDFDCSLVHRRNRDQKTQWFGCEYPRATFEKRFHSLDLLNTGHRDLHSCYQISSSFFTLPYLTESHTCGLVSLWSLW